jgi:hypothetical protein
MELKIKTAAMRKAYQEVRDAYSVSADGRFREQTLQRRQVADAAFAEAAAKLTEALEAAQKGARVRKITAEDIMEELMDYENRLNIPKKHMKDITVWIDHNAQAFPNAYKGIPESTIFNARHDGSEWIITQIYRGKCDGTKGGASLPEAAQQAIIKAMAKI